MNYWLIIIIDKLSSVAWIRQKRVSNENEKWSLELWK